MVPFDILIYATAARLNRPKAHTCICMYHWKLKKYLCRIVDFRSLGHSKGTGLDSQQLPPTPVPHPPTPPGAGPSACLINDQISELLSNQ